MLSERFVKFVMFKCRIGNTGGVFIGPEWARRAYNKALGTAYRGRL